MSDHMHIDLSSMRQMRFLAQKGFYEAIDSVLLHLKDTSEEIERLKTREMKWDDKYGYPHPGDIADAIVKKLGYLIPNARVDLVIKYAAEWEQYEGRIDTMERLLAELPEETKAWVATQEEKARQRQADAEAGLLARKEKEAKQCAQLVGSLFHGQRCSFTGTIEIDGRKYCTKHAKKRGWKEA